MRKLDYHQRLARGFLSRKKGKAGLFLAPGTGKTATAINYAQCHSPRLVICRRDDFLTWQLQLAEDGFIGKDMFLIDSGKVKLPGSPYPWNLITYDLVKNKRIRQWIQRNNFAIVFADESHLIKHWRSKRTKAVVRSTRHIPRRVPMTGSAIGNTVKDVFSQCLFIDDGKTFGKKEWFFLLKYFIREGKAWYPKRNSKAEVIRKLKKIAVYVDEDDVLKLPPKYTTTKGAPMYGKQRRLYEQVINDWEVQVNEGLVEINQVIVQLSKLRQIASGFLYDEDHNAHWMKCGKLDLLQKLVKDPDALGNKPKIVIWCAHTAEIEKIHELLGGVMFRGSKRKEKEAARMIFKNDPKCQFFIGQVDSGVGMNELIVADTAIYYGNSMKVNSKQQSMRRNRRRGSEVHDRIDYYELVTEGSIDVKLMGDVRSKMSVANEILDGIKSGASIRQLLA